MDSPSSSLIKRVYFVSGPILDHALNELDYEGNGRILSDQIISNTNSQVLF